MKVEEFKKYESVIKYLYDEISYSYDKEDILEDIKHDYLTLNIGRDNETYIWYMDENKSIAINVKNKKILTNAEVESILL